jgi:hypothetical protein
MLYHSTDPLPDLTADDVRDVLRAWKLSHREPTYGEAARLVRRERRHGLEISL